MVTFEELMILDNKKYQISVRKSIVWVMVILAVL